MHGKRILFLFIVVLLATQSAFAAGNEERIDNSQLESITLDENVLTLNVGQSHTFSVTFQPGVPNYDRLSWVSTNNQVVAVEAESNTAAAKAPGKAILYARAADSGIFAFCQVTVTGDTSTPSTTKDAGTDISAILKLTEAELTKIEDNGLLSYIAFVRQFQDEIILLDLSSFRVLINYSPEAREKIIELAHAAFPESTAYDYADSIAVQAEAEQIASFLHANFEQIISIQSDSMLFIQESDTVSDPADYWLVSRDGLQGLSIEEYMALHPMQEPLSSKAITLEGFTEELTSVSTAHNNGLYGLGNVVAILDTGLNAAHPEFSNRVVRQACFSSHAEEAYPAICDQNGATSSLTSAYPYAKRIKYFNHGSHVTGIAAGKGGIAQQAGIAHVLVFSEIEESNGSTAFISDIASGLEQVIKWYDEGTNIVSINLSMGGSKFSSTCDDYEATVQALFSELISRGILPVVSSGNNFWDGYITWPACISSAYAVGALWNVKNPEIGKFSNHSELVSLLAPGTLVYSSFLNGYSYDAGTSMAAPMVSGAIALTKNYFMDSDGLKMGKILKTMSTKSAARNGITKPVLDFSQSAAYLPNETPQSIGEPLSGVHSIFLRWQPVADAEGYYVWGSTEGFPEGVSVPKQTAASAQIFYDVKETQLNVSGLVNGTEYYFTIRSYRHVGDAVVLGRGSLQLTGTTVASRSITFFPLIFSGKGGGSFSLPNTGFATQHFSKLKTQPRNLTYGSTAYRLEIPIIDVSAKLVKTPMDEGGVYAVDWLGNDVGLLEGSQLPGEGVSVIVGHNHLNTMKSGPFLFLSELDENDSIFISKGGSKPLIYRVYENLKINPNDLETLQNETRENALVLVTCEDEMISGGYASRRVVFAEIMY